MQEKSTDKLNQFNMEMKAPNITIMTIKQLKQKVKWYYLNSYHNFIIVITYKNKSYKCISNNWRAIYDYGKINKNYYKNDKECLMELYNECKTKNQLNLLRNSNARKVNK